MLKSKTRLKRKTPLKRGNSQLKRTSPLKSGGKPSPERLTREAYLRQFRGIPCEICGKTHFSKQKSTIHHILKAEMYPEYYYAPWNRIVLCPVCHVPFAHDKESEFLKWLHDNKPEQAAIVKEHRHHRR